MRLAGGRRVFGRKSCPVRGELWFRTHFLRSFAPGRVRGCVTVLHGVRQLPKQLPTLRRPSAIRCQGVVIQLEACRISPDCLAGVSGILPPSCGPWIGSARDVSDWSSHDSFAQMTHSPVFQRQGSGSRRVVKDSVFSVRATPARVDGPTLVRETHVLRLLLRWPQCTPDIGYRFCGRRASTTRCTLCSYLLCEVIFHLVCPNLFPALGVGKRLRHKKLYFRDIPCLGGSLVGRRGAHLQPRSGATETRTERVKRVGCNPLRTPGRGVTQVVALRGTLQR